MGGVDFASCWGTEALHAIIRGTEENCAEPVDEQVEHQIEFAHRLTVPIIKDLATTRAKSIQAQGPSEEYEINEKDAAS
jgi:hypothetical protein